MTSANNLDADTADRSNGLHRGRVLAGVWCLYAAFGLFVSSTGALVPSIREDLGLSRSDMGVVLSAWQFAYIGASLPAGRLIDRLGLRRALTVCVVVMVASVAMRALAWNMLSLAVTVGLLGLGGPIISIGAPKAAALLFDGASRRRAVGIYGTGPAVGGAIALATANGVVGSLVDHSWRGVLLIYAGLAALAGVFWWWASASLDSRPAEEATPVHFRELTRLPVVQLILVVAVVSFTFMHGLGQWTVDLLQNGGRSVEAAGYLAAVGSLIGIVGTLWVPRLARAERRRLVLVVTLLSGAAGTSLLLSSSLPLLFAGLTFSVLARVAVMPIAMLVLMDDAKVGPTNMAGAGSLFFTAAQFGGVAGPWLTGVLADAGDGFGVAVGVHVALMVAVAALFATMLPRVTSRPDAAVSPRVGGRATRRSR